MVDLSQKGWSTQRILPNRPETFVVQHLGNGYRPAVTEAERKKEIWAPAPPPTMRPPPRNPLFDVPSEMVPFTRTAFETTKARDSKAPRVPEDKPRAGITTSEEEARIIRVRLLEEPSVRLDPADEALRRKGKRVLANPASRVPPRSPRRIGSNVLRRT